MKWRQLIALASLAASVCIASDGGDAKKTAFRDGNPVRVPEQNIDGIVRLIGTPPPEKELPLDSTCGSLHIHKPMTRF